MEPEVDFLYFGTVKDVTKFGLTVKLNGFSKNFEGLIHTSELTGALSKLIVGNLVNVRVVSFSNGFIALTLKGIDQPVNKARVSIVGVDDSYMQHKRKIRVASPGRREISQYTDSLDNLKIEVKKEEPQFLKNISNGYIPSKIPKQVNIFRDQNSHMTKIAKEKMKSQTEPAFYFTESGFMHNFEKFYDSRMATVMNPSGNKSNSIDYKNRNKMSIKKQRESLPIFKFREEIIKSVTENKVLIVIAETGSGKTTQIPQYLVEAGFVMHGKIACTQPRRFAASSIALRVAEEYGCVLGQDVGYKVRFDDQSSPSTVIKYMTDGILLRECLTDANLDKYSVIILDEAHERTIHTDVLFGLLKDAVKRKPSLRLIVSSATLDSVKFAQFFDNAKVLNIPGAMYPVETFYYRYQISDYFNEALNTVLNIHMREPDGDILLFLTGQDEIEKACEQLETYVKGNQSRFALNLIVLQMFSALPSDLQSEVLMPAPRGSRKVIVATNIAEASVTIDGIRFVVDPGYAKQKVYDPKTCMDTLTIIPISQASANQRLGRAGRTAPGKCYRLYPKTAYEKELLPETVPEIQRSDLSSVILYLKAIGVKDILGFDFMDPPQKDNIIVSLKQLYLLGALDSQGSVTDLGIQMTVLPVDPHLAKMLVTSAKLKCTDEIITIVAMLSVGKVFYRPRKNQVLADEKKKNFQHNASDHLTLLNVFKKWEQNYYSAEWCHTNYLNGKKLLEALDIRKNLLTIMESRKYEIYSAGLNFSRIQEAIISGFFQNIACRAPTMLGRSINKTYRTIDGTEAFIHPSSSLFHVLPVCIVYNNMAETSKKFLIESTIINPLWLQKHVPHLYQVQSKTTSLFPHDDLCNIDVDEMISALNDVAFYD